MQLVYSVFRPKDISLLHKSEAATDIDLLRLQAYNAVCDKYQKEIAAIRQWMPDWQPEFRLKNY